MKKRNITGVLGLAILAILIISGCQTSVNTVENQQKEMQPEFVPSKNIITDSFLKKRLEILRVDKQTLPNGLLKVQVTAKNMRTGFWDWLFYDSDEPYNISYCFNWLNSSGMKVSTASSTWIPMQIEPGETVFIQSVAPNEQCKDFLLELKELKD